jgi:hypothetical protein
MIKIPEKGRLTEQVEQERDKVKSRHVSEKQPN